MKLCIGKHSYFPQKIQFLYFSSDEYFATTVLLCIKDKRVSNIRTSTCTNCHGKDAKWLSYTNTAANTHIHTQFDGDSLLKAWGKGLNTDASTHQQTCGRVHLPERLLLVSNTHTTAWQTAENSDALLICISGKTSVILIVRILYHWQA